MNRRFGFALALVALTVAGLIYSAVTATAKSVVTVAELRALGGQRSDIRLGARVAMGEIRQTPEPTRSVQFSVRDIKAPEEEKIPVVYEGFMPDTLKVGRDVILEGSFDGTTFQAKNLVTQCPSKYVPPAPGSSAGVSAGTAPGVTQESQPDRPHD